ncbi:MAG TPA: creatininase family protein [Trueperaceae bacterium]|nr:creatininase family protein [Trueperaceae bacterium]
MSPPSSTVLRLAGAAKGRFGSAPFAVLPVGSIEFHGPNAAFGTDSTLAAGFAERLAATRDCLVFPPVHYSFVPRLTRDHGPAVSIAPAVFLAYLTEVLGGIVATGVDRLLVINGHSENQYSLRLAAEQVTAAAPSASVLLCNWWRLAPAGLFEDADGHGHGGPLEISTAASFDAGGVELAPDVTADIGYEAPWWRSAAQVVGRGQAPAGFSGYHGSISEVDLNKGATIVDTVTRELLRLVDDWLERAATQSRPADS